MSYRYDAYDEYLAYVRSAQPPPISAEPTIHPDSAAARLGLTQEEMGEILADQEEWMREEEEQEWRREGLTVPEETHQQQQEQDSNTDTRTPPPPLEYTHDTTLSHLNFVLKFDMEFYLLFTFIVSFNAHKYLGKGELQYSLGHYFTFSPG
jgi:hypothetical protein